MGDFVEVSPLSFINSSHFTVPHNKHGFELNSTFPDVPFPGVISHNSNPNPNTLSYDLP
jgi:hypothetical protein